MPIPPGSAIPSRRTAILTPSPKISSSSMIDVTDVNADAKFDPLDLRHVDILFVHAALDFDGAAYGIYNAPELNESAVPGILDDAPAMITDLGIKKRLSKSFELRQRAFFIDPYQA